MAFPNQCEAAAALLAHAIPEFRDWRATLIVAATDANAKLPHALVNASDLNSTEIGLPESLCCAICGRPGADIALDGRVARGNSPAQAAYARQGAQAAGTGTAKL